MIEGHTTEEDYEYDECCDCRYSNYEGMWPTEACPSCDSKSYIDLWMRRVELEIMCQ